MSQHSRQTVALDQDTTIAFDTVGDGDVPLVLLHGFMCSREMWDEQLPELAGVGRLIAFDFPGHGASRSPLEQRAFSEDGLADLTMNFIQALGIDRAILVGFSMGGGVALNAALRHSSAVAGLFLADVGGGSADPQSHREAMSELEGFLAREGFEPLVDRLLDSPTFSDFASRGPSERARMRSMLMQTDADALRMLIPGVLAARQPVQERMLESINVPTRVVVGELDEQCRMPSWELSSRIRGARLDVIEGSGHMTPMEQPAAFNAHLRDIVECWQGLA